MSDDAATQDELLRLRAEVARLRRELGTRDEERLATAAEVADLRVARDSVSHELAALADANAHAAELMVELEETKVSLSRQVGALADANAHAAELMVELEETKASLFRQVGALADANARSAELMVELEEANEAGEALRAQLVRAHREAVSANQQKSAFLASMSHELRTPLNAILGYGEMLEEMALEEGYGEAADDLRKIIGAGQHLLSLVNAVLDLSKVEAGKMEVINEPFDVRELVHDVVTTIRPLVEQRGNLLLVEVADDVGEMVADPPKVRQLLLNLLSNANKFTDRGRIVVEVSRARGGIPRMVFAVTDEGVGMTPEQLGRVFEPFTQAERDTSRVHGGTGLGLTITRKLCELMGGDIGASSEPGRGSRFSFWLPAESPPVGAVVSA